MAGRSRSLTLIGLDTCVAIMEVLHEGLGSPKYAPCPLLRQYVQAGRLGRKSGQELLHVFVSGELRAWLDVGDGSDEEFVDGVFALVLRRDPEPEARERALASSARNGSRATLCRSWRRRQVRADPAARRRDRVRARRQGARRAATLAPRPAGHRRARDRAAVGLSRLSGRRARVGYAFAEPPYLAALLRAGFDELVGVDLASADVPGLTGVEADVRDLPFGDSSFDLVLCVSTLEHVGADNTGYGLQAEDDADSRRTALRELRRPCLPPTAGS